MAVLVATRLVSRIGLVTRRLRDRRRRRCRVAIQRTCVRRHRQLLKQQAEERNQRDPTTVVATAHWHHSTDNDGMDRREPLKITPSCVDMHIHAIAMFLFLAFNARPKPMRSAAAHGDFLVVAVLTRG